MQVPLTWDERLRVCEEEQLALIAAAREFLAEVASYCERHTEPEKETRPRPDQPAS